MATEEWFCDQCGARYPEPGECTNQHPAATLKPVGADVTVVRGDEQSAFSDAETLKVEEPAVAEPVAATTGAGAVTPLVTPLPAPVPLPTPPHVGPVLPPIPTVPDTSAVRAAFDELEAAAVKLKGLLS